MQYVSIFLEKTEESSSRSFLGPSVEFLFWWRISLHKKYDSAHAWDPFPWLDLGVVVCHSMFLQVWDGKILTPGGSTTRPTKEHITIYFFSFTHVDLSLSSRDAGYKMIDPIFLE